mgnify:CR=1 FL=1
MSAYIKEIKNIKAAHIYDGVALTKYLFWVKKNFEKKKISELTLINVMMEAQIQDLQTQLNSMKAEQQSENDLDGNENQTKEIDDSSSSPDDF